MRRKMENKKQPGRRGILKTYFETTTIKGVPKFMKSTSSFLKLMWFLVVIIGLSISLYLLIRLFRLYLSYSTVTSIEEYDDSNYQEQNLPFPDITVCNLNSIATHPKDRSLYEEYLQDVMKIINELDRRNVTLKNDSLMTSDVRHLFDGYGFFQSHPLDPIDNAERIHNLFVSCKAAGIKWIDCAKEGSIYVSVFDTSVAPCFTVNMTAVTNGSVDWVKGITAVFHLNEMGNFTFNYRGFYDPSLKQTHAAGVVLMVHAPGFAPSALEYVNLSPGTHSTLHLEPLIKRRLPNPYSNCDMGQRKMHENGLYGRYLEDDIQYSSSHCNEICFHVQLTEECGCIMADAFHTKKMQKEFPYCGEIERYDDVSELLDALNCTHNFMRQGGHDRSRCDCPKQCHVTEYNIKSSSTPWPHSSYELVFFDEHIKKSKTFTHAKEYEHIDIESLEGRRLISKNFLQVHIIFDRSRLIKFIDKPALDIPTVIGSLGGILNLWIGISFVTIFEVVELIYCLLRYRDST